MKKLLFIPFLLITSICLAAPDSSLSVTPSATAGTTITAADENSRNSAITTWANNHDHTDISQTANTLKLGDATAGNKTIQANNADASKPSIYFDDTNDRWILTQEGTDARTLVVLTGSTTGHYIIPESPSDEDVLLYDADVNNGELKFTKTLDINGGTIDGVTIGASSAPTVTDLGTVTTADINGGTLDGVQVGGTTATGELLVNNSSDAADGLGSQGTSGQFLQSAGTGSNPTWTSGLALAGHVDTTAVVATSNITIAADKTYIAYYQGKSNASTDALLGIRFNDDTSGYVNIGTGSAITDQVDLSAGSTHDADSTFWGTVHFSTIDTETSMIVRGSVHGVWETTGNVKTVLDQVFQYTDSSAITSIELMADASMQNAIITVYELSL